ncbi:MAG: carbohydrate ABC transporter permease [Oscillospiraceae bacterium]|nr:carbohydrate ABC transporter permease [Oscillospiraceae bacterium]
MLSKTGYQTEGVLGQNVSYGNTDRRIEYTKWQKKKRRTMRGSLRRGWKGIFVKAALVILGVVIMYPLIVTFSNSFMSGNEISYTYTSRLTVFDIVNGIQSKFIQIPVIPGSATVSQYSEVLINQPSFMVLLTNSLKIAVPVVLGNLIVSLLTAFGFTMWKWKYKETVFFIYIVVMLMPLQAVLVPNYIIADRLGLTNSYLAIILPGIFAPFGTFLLRQSLKAMPKEYFEAAQVDGASFRYIFTNIVIPQMKSGIAALSMLVFIEYWNVVEQVVIFIKDYIREPLSVYLSRLSSSNADIIFAASCIYMFLPLWFLLLGQEDLEKGIELSGIK